MKALRIILLLFFQLCLVVPKTQAQLILNYRVSIYDPVDIFSGEESMGWGAIVDGDTVLQPKYKHISLLGDNHLLLTLQGKNDKIDLYGVSNLRGQIVLECIHNSIGEVYANASVDPDLERDIIKPIKDERAYMVVEQMPFFPGGDTAMMEYLFSNLRYPESDCEEFGIQTRVIIRFVVDVDGSIQDVKALRGICPALDKVAIDVIKSMPKWEAGKQDGEAVPVYFTLPIHFSPRRSK